MSQPQVVSHDSRTSPHPMATDHAASEKAPLVKSERFARLVATSAIVPGGFGVAFLARGFETAQDAPLVVIATSILATALFLLAILLVVGSIYLHLFAVTHSDT